MNKILTKDKQVSEYQPGNKSDLPSQVQGAKGSRWEACQEAKELIPPATRVQEET